METINQKYSLGDIIKQLERAEEDIKEISEIRGTLIVNYCSPDRPGRHVANKNDNTYSIMMQVLSWYEEQLKG